LANSASRCWSVIFCLKRRRCCMACTFPSEEGGSATGVLITGISHYPGCDENSVSLPRELSESYLLAWRGNLWRITQAAQMA
jgi:hypothetical protein